MTNQTRAKNNVIPTKAFIALTAAALIVIVGIFVWKLTAPPHTPRVNLYPRTATTDHNQ